ncbi:Antigen WC1.1 [Camelus dromedarius]|uniref:Antigen WC1.1 n=1 Tax=Camelus dromedarius TaxID=9838 RepID=A0A5N4C672_CAMDR|nr:Antigen WC1.1 [Camelus dromedarius]
MTAPAFLLSVSSGPMGVGRIVLFFVMFFSTLGFLSDGSVSQLPYYIGDGAEDSDHKFPPEPPDQRTEAPSEGYDDAEEVPLPEAPSASRMREGEVPPEEETGMRASQTGEWVS